MRHERRFLRLSITTYGLLFTLPLLRIWTTIIIPDALPPYLLTCRTIADTNGVPHSVKGNGMIHTSIVDATQNEGGLLVSELTGLIQAQHTYIQHGHSAYLAWLRRGAYILTLSLIPLIRLKCPPFLHYTPPQLRHQGVQGLSSDIRVHLAVRP